MDKNKYRDMIMSEHLSTDTYEKVDINENKKVYKDLLNLTSKHKECLTKDEIKYITDEDWKDARFYGLPKLHKCKEIMDRIKVDNEEYLKIDHPNSLKTRPICGGPNAVTQGASKLLHNILSPLVPHIRSHIKDEWDFVKRFPKKINYNARLLSCDIVSLYPSIPLELGLEALEYWIDRLRFAIPTRFTKESILELAKLVLENNNCEFDSEIYHQAIGTSMGSIFAPPYSCLVIGYLEETKLYPLLRDHFDEATCRRIIECFFRFMDDGTTLFPADVDENLFLRLLNSMHPAIQYTMEKAEISIVNGVLIQKLVFLSLLIFLDSNGNIWTDVFYKQTNTHDYLNFESHHPTHIKNNIPYNLAKRIIVFTSCEEAVKRNLADLTRWLEKCGYPNKIIEKGIHDALLQGPANQKEDKKIIPLVSTNFSNYSNEMVLQLSKSLIRNCRNDRMKNAFKDVQFIHAFRQPPNMLRSLSHSKFITSINRDNEKVGVFHCKHGGCKICKLYLQTGTTIPMSNGETWNVKCYADCNSWNVLYFLVCNGCLIESYIGKTDDTRYRTNNHISGCRLGHSTNKFDNHVHQCIKDNGNQHGKHQGTDFSEPYFTMYIMMVCNSYHKLLAYESYLHSKGLDTTNNPS